MSTFSYTERRVGCASCDLVTGMLTVIPETELHTFRCPICKAQDLHHYPVTGSYPSDYDVPPCVTTIDWLQPQPPIANP